MANFRQWRKERKLTQEQAADMIGVSKSTWGRIERGQETKEAFLLLAEALVNNADPVVIDRPVVVVAEPEQPTQDSQTALMQFDASQVRTEIINGVVWINLADVCRVIEYANPTHALRLIEPDDLQKCSSPDSLGRLQEYWFVNESGLNDFLLCSNVPKARPFKRWVTSEVLPSIRKTGSYAVAQPAPTTGIMPQWAELLLQQMGGTVVEVRQQQAAQQAQIEQMQAVVATMPAQAAEQAAEAVLKAMQALNSRKARLHELVHSIVNQAKALPQDDPDAQYYSQYGNTWRTVHRHARPAVSSKNDYVTVDQVDHAISGGEAILTRLGGRPEPAQMRLDFGVAV